MPPTQLPQHFRRGNTCDPFALGNRSTFCCFLLPTSHPGNLRDISARGINVLFTLGNRSISCYGTFCVVKTLYMLNTFCVLSNFCALNILCALSLFGTLLSLNTFCALNAFVHESLSFNLFNCHLLFNEL